MALSKSDIRVAIGACAQYAQVLYELGGFERPAFDAPARFSRWAIRSGTKEAVVPSIAIMRARGTTMPISWAERSCGHCRKNAFDRNSIDEELTDLALKYATDELVGRASRYIMEDVYFVLCPLRFQEILQEHLATMGDDDGENRLA